MYLTETDLKWAKLKCIEQIDIDANCYLTLTTNKEMLSCTIKGLKKV